MRNGNSFDEVGDRFEGKLLDKSKHLREHHLEMVGKFQEKIAALEAERDALKAYIDKGVRVGVYDGDSGLSVTFTENKLCNKFNATLIIDDGVEL